MYAIVLGFSDTRLDGTQKFVGLENFFIIARDPDFLGSFPITFGYAAMTVVGATLVGLGTALVAHSQFKGRTILRSILGIPWAIPWVAIGLMWAFTFDLNHGYLNSVLSQLNFITEPINFLSPETALPAVSVASVWLLSSFTAIFVLASLQTIDPIYYEAAIIDGAGIFGKFRHVTLPLIQPVLSFTVLSNGMIALTMFDVIYVMTKGGPGTATLTLSMNAFRTFFQFMSMGEGAAIALVMTALTMMFGIPFLTFFYRRVYR
jgi:ABC-type sugar transport system permease subunit